MKKIFILGLILLLSNCSTVKMKKLTTEDKFDNPYVSFYPPSTAPHWYIYVYDSPWQTNSDKTAYWKTLVNRKAASTTIAIEVNALNFDYMPIDILFDSQGDYEARRQYLNNTPQTLARNKEQNISYDMDETQYFKGMRCLGSVFSRGNKDYSKNYSLTCGYYHLTEGKRIFGLDYRFYGGGLGVRLDKDGAPEDLNLKKSDAETVLKQSVKELLSTVELKDVDWERMKKEGLLHEKEFESIQW